MAECQMVKTDNPSLFYALDDALKGVTQGEVITVKYSFARHPVFHRKAMSLFRFLHDALPDPDPIILRGKAITPLRDFDVTRQELTIMAGFYDVVAKLDGTVKAKAKSLSFGSMEQDEFERVYSAVIDVGLRVLPYTMTAAELDKAVENLILGYS